MFRKLVFVTITGLLMSVALCAQDAGKLVVPAAVKNKMMAMFPQTQKVPVTWSRENANYAGTLTIMEKPAVAVFDSTGKVIRIEKRLHISYLPKKVIDQLDKQYPGNEIMDIYELTDGAGKKSYKTTFQYKQTSVYNAEGGLVK